MRHTSPTIPSRRVGAGLAVMVGLSLVSACSGSEAPVATVPPTTVAPSTTVRVDDGEFVIGVVAPTSGAAAGIGASVRDGAHLAVGLVNESGGVGGRPVRLLERDEGDNPASAALALQDMVELGADAIIGPTSSLNVLATLGSAVDSGLLVCSPTATAMALDDFPDDGLFVRTVPSDSMQASAIGALVEQTGNERISVVHVDDDYGRSLAAAVAAAIEARGSEVMSVTAFSATEASIAAVVDRVGADAAEVVVVLADGSTGPAVITAIDDATDDTPNADGDRPAPLFVVNDAIRRPLDQTAPFDADLAGRIIGVSPVTYPGDDFLLSLHERVDPDTDGPFAENAYDCAVAMALAAEAAGSTMPRAIGAMLANVTTSGTQCSTFAECLDDLRAGRNIDYDGPGASLGIGLDGELTSAYFDRFTFDVSGRDVNAGFIAIGDD